MSTDAPRSNITQPTKKRVAILASGSGSNMQALVEASLADDFPAEIVLVITNKTHAGCLERAEKFGIPALTIPSKAYDDRASHEAAISAAIEEAEIDIICLAGYMRVFTDYFIARWQGKLINIHPSILPLFPGLHTHQRAIDAGCRVHGCTVHFVTLGMDEGPVIAQGVVPIMPQDDANALAARVLKVEHQIYPKALALFASHKVRMDDQEKAVFDDGYQADISQQLISA